MRRRAAAAFETSLVEANFARVTNAVAHRAQAANRVFQQNRPEPVVRRRQLLRQMDKSDDKAIR